METTNSGYFAYCSIHVHFYSYKGFFFYRVTLRSHLNRGFATKYFRYLDFKRLKKKVPNRVKETQCLNCIVYFTDIQLCNMGSPNNIYVTKSYTSETPAMVKNPCLYETWVHVFQLFRF